MPQIAQIAATYSSQIFWMLVVFAIIYFMIGMGMVPKIESTVDAREKRISGDLAAAEAARAEADATEDAYRARIEAVRADALKATGEAKRSAALATEAQVKAADAVLAAQADAAEASLTEQRAAVFAGLETVAAEAVQDIVSRVSAIAIDRADAERAVKAALAA